MDFNNPKVRQVVLEHIRFAVDVVEAAIPDSSIMATDSSADRAMTEMVNALRNPIIMQVLQFTLVLDYRLKNSLLYNTNQSLEDEPRR